MSARFRWTAVLLVMAVAAPLVIAAARTATRRPVHTAPLAARADGGAGDARRGLALLNGFRDSLPAHSGNHLRCTSCHLDNGLRAQAMPWIGTAARYPRYRGRRGSQESLPQRLNDCITRSLAGRALPEDGRDMRDMIAYLETLNSASRPTGPDTVKLAGSARAGRPLYAQECARCHGAAGEGLLAPAVWGRHSYSIGAGLARQTVLATFVKINMPHDRAGTLSARQAADIAAFVLSQPRQDHPGKENDWPKGDPPADVAYVTTAAQAARKPLPPPRPLLARRVRPFADAAPPAKGPSGP